MIYNFDVLKNKYREYSNINQKISSEVKKGTFTRIKKGMFSDNLSDDACVIANVCCEPSYLSFEYVLSQYGLIPEYVPMYTSACYRKKNNRIYKVNDKTFEYRYVPDEVFFFGVTYMTNQQGIRYKIANKEKALCDTLYTKYPVRSIQSLEYLLFNDLRIDEEEFRKLDYTFIKEIAQLYHSSTLLMLKKYLEKEK